MQIKKPKTKITATATIKRDPFTGRASLPKFDHEKPQNTFSELDVKVEGLGATTTDLDVRLLQVEQRLQEVLNSRT